MHNHWLFIGNMFAHLVASMSGIVSLCIAIYEAFKKKRIESRVFFIVGALFLIVASDEAWQDEHHNTLTLISEKLSIGSDRDFWKQQSFDKDAALRQRDVVLSESQTSLAKLAEKILDINKPEPQKFSVRADHVDYPQVSQGQRVAELIITTNKPIAANLTFSCDRAIPTLSAHIAGGGPHYPNSVERIYENAWNIHIPAPLITPQDPLVIVVVSQTAAGTLERCGIKKQ